MARKNKKNRFRIEGAEIENTIPVSSSRDETTEEVSNSSNENMDPHLDENYESESEPQVTATETSQESIDDGDDLVVVRDSSRAKNIIAAALALIFVVAVGYMSFNYFNGAVEVNDDQTELANQDSQQEETEGTEQLGDILTGASTYREETQGTAKIDNNVVTGKDATQTATKDTLTYWTANDYKYGDIENESNYTVQEGDTLWEIAEAAYGDGSQWVQILNANQNQVGFLPNGQQSLIFAGQSLAIP